MSMTTNQPSVVDEDALTVTRTIRIAAPIEKVWSAVTDPAHISQWFGVTVLDGSGVGATGTMTFPDYGAVPLRVEAIDEPHLVTYRWGNDDAGELLDHVDDEQSTVFTFTLLEIGSGTQLTVVETGFERTSNPLANARDHGTGWTDELDKLVALLEAGS
jgi:uncharacterized protein YndB with AHSA1/START domain